MAPLDHLNPNTLTQMNKTITTILLLSLLTTACNHTQDLERDQTSDVIGIRASIQDLTRALATSFAPGDAISVYALKAGDRSKVLIDNSVNTYDGSSWHAAPEMRWSDRSVNYDFVAVHPSGSIADLEASAFTLGSDMGANDLLVATNLNLPLDRAEDVALDFEHVMSKVTVKLSYSAAFVVEPVVERVVVRARHSGTVNYMTKVVSASGPISDLSLGKVSKDEYWGIVAPEIIGASSELILIYVQGEVLPYIYRTASDVEFEAKKERTIGLTLEPSASGARIARATLNANRVRM